MANPQVERGFTRIADEILDALAKTYLPSNEWQVIMAIIRLTYGYGKKSDRIALSQIADLTGIDRRIVHRAIGGLSSKQMIAVIRTDDRSPKNIRIQKDYERWKKVFTQGAVICTDDRTVIRADDNHREIESKDKHLSSGPKKLMICPHVKIIEIYHETLPELPRVKVLNGKRRRSLLARWKMEERFRDLEWWRRFFRKVRTIPYLMGEVKDWNANIDYLLREEPFIAIIEGGSKWPRK